MPCHRSRPTHRSTRQSLPSTATRARSSTTSPAHTLLLRRARSQRWCASESLRRYRPAPRVRSLHLRPLRAHKNALQLHNSDKPVLSATRSGKKSPSTVTCSFHGPVSRDLSITKQPPAYPTHRPCLRTDLLTPSRHNQSLPPSWTPLVDRSMTTCLRFQLAAFNLDSRQAYRYLAHSTRPLELYSHRRDLCTRQ